MRGLNGISRGMQKAILAEARRDVAKKAGKRIYCPACGQGFHGEVAEADQRYREHWKQNHVRTVTQNTPQSRQDAI